MAPGQNGSARAPGHHDEYRQWVTMIELIVLGLIAAAFAVASLLLLLLLIDVLVRRADITAALLIGSTLMDAFFAQRSPIAHAARRHEAGIHRYHRNTCPLCRVRKTSSDAAPKSLPTMAGPIHNSSRSIVGKRSYRFRNPDQRK